MRYEDIVALRKYRLNSGRVFEYFDGCDKRCEISVPAGEEVTAISVIVFPCGAVHPDHGQWQSVLCAVPVADDGGYATGTTLVGAHNLAEIPPTIDEIEVDQVYRTTMGLQFTAEGWGGLLLSSVISEGSVVSVRAKIGDLVVVETRDPVTEALVFRVVDPDKLQELPMPEAEI